jgi:CHAT domain-containing protein/tetratricopeptide (TPR) repeat protein
MQSSEMMYPPVVWLHLNSRALSLVAMFKQGGGTSYIDEAIAVDRDAVQLCPPGHPMRSVSLTRLAVHLGDRYDQLGATRDLDEAIVLDREALTHHSQGYRERWMSLNNLARHLCSRYKQLSAKEDIDEAIVLGREALELPPQGHPDRSTLLNNLTVILSTLYEQLGEMKVLDEVIVLEREALDHHPQGHPDRSMSLHNLAIHLYTRYYKHLGAMEDLNEAIVLDREALDLPLQGHPHRSMSLINLSACLASRYIQLGAKEDLNEAIFLGREALELRPQGHPDRSTPLDNLAAYLFTRYEQLGATEDLDGAIFLGREALELRPQGHPHRSSSLDNLSICLSSRYNQLGATQDLDEAIVLGREALDLCLQGDPDRSISLNNLATHLYLRFKQFGTMGDLEETIVLDREALDLRPQGHLDRSTSLNNLAIRLSTRYNQLWEIQDLDEATVLVQEALHLRPQGHPDRSSSLNDLAAHLVARYNQLGAMEDLNEAILLDQEALHLRPQGHPDRFQSLENLARHLYNRFTRSKQLQDKEELFSLYAQLVNVPQLVSSTDLSAARAWIDMAEHFHHPTILLAYETSLRLLIQHLANLPSLPQHLVILKNLTSSLGVDAFSACLRQSSPSRAVELLEQGRGVFWSQLTRLHSPLDEAIVSSPAGKALTDEFTRLASLIRNVLHSPGADQHERVCHLNLELQTVVTDIRKLPGLSRFLLPSLFSDLRRAASLGPVIIVNASDYGCDALIVFLDQDPVHIPLQITRENVRELSTELHTMTSRAKRADVTKELAFFLRKLWDQIVSPIVDYLQTTLPSKSRIWWCPTGEFSVLPLHAAGPYRKGQQNLPHIYISSYTPTLNALIRARRGDPSNSAPDQKRFIAIGQASATGETELVSVGAELDIIGQRINSLATFTRIDGEESCISSVVEELGKHEWVHLACHGLPDRKQPFESAFALHDGHFTIQRIIGCDLKNPEFAYLSACHTTVGDEKSPDEVIHLASAMQFVGFRSVIGTMWAVDDGATIKIASTFYNHMVDESGRLDHTRAAFALNETMKSVRNIPFDQRILYIHLGV